MVEQERRSRLKELLNFPSNLFRNSRRSKEDVDLRSPLPSSACLTCGVSLSNDHHVIKYSLSSLESTFTFTSRFAAIAAPSPSLINAPPSSVCSSASASACTRAIAPCYTRTLSSCSERKITASCGLLPVVPSSHSLSLSIAEKLEKLGQQLHKKASSSNLNPIQRRKPSDTDARSLSTAKPITKSKAKSKSLAQIDTKAPFVLSILGTPTTASSIGSWVGSGKNHVRKGSSMDFKCRGSQER
ncbi:hypothetical protein AX17_007487 [Amanita inopinata Kibby_2008]|nr:hypothetical protein AX17_007487 [Amanita inopinata Kibby_2008]